MGTIEYSTLIWQIVFLAISLGIVVVVFFLAYKLGKLISSRSSSQNERLSEKQNSK